MKCIALYFTACFRSIAWLGDVLFNGGRLRERRAVNTNIARWLEEWEQGQALPSWVVEFPKPQPLPTERTKKIFGPLVFIAAFGPFILFGGYCAHSALKIDTHDKNGRPLTREEQTSSGLKGTESYFCTRYLSKCENDKLICRYTEYTPANVFSLEKYDNTSNICEYIKGYSSVRIDVKHGAVYRVRGGY